MTHFSTYDVLTTKRKGLPLSPDEIAWFIRGFNEGEITDYQMSAFLMAVAIRGMERTEIAALTAAMIDSGERWNLHKEVDFLADKHSTGGVGDKVSLCLTPWVAACGVKIAMLSGRGLGHTGGTLDKLDSIPGFEARLSRDELLRVVREVGCAIGTSTSGIAPADRRMYALRDVTATVESIPLITASIMSKKLAMGPTALLLDVKFGSGAFMKTEAESVALAESLMSAAHGTATRVEALITSMEAPLGRTVGNANEVIEAFQMLRDRQPSDLYEVTKAQALRILVMSGRFDEGSADRELEAAITSGAALEKSRAWIVAQGGDPAFLDDPTLLASPRKTVEVTAETDGFITDIDTYAVGMLGVALGAGRLKQDDEVDPAPGILIHANRGDRVEAGQSMATIGLGQRDFAADDLVRRYRAAVRIGDHAPVVQPLVRRLLQHKENG